MKKVLFVCTGNTCRSPLAEGLFRDAVKDRTDFEVSSAGVSAGDGHTPSPDSVAVASSRGVDITDQRSSGITPEMVDEATHIFCMTQDHLGLLNVLFPEATGKAYLMCEFSEINGRIGIDVPDPIGMGEAAYEDTCATLEIAIPSLLEFIDQTTELTKMSSTKDISPEDAVTMKTESPKIIIGADHGGLELKDAVLAHLKEKGFEVDDIGAFSKESVDYPDYAAKVCTSLLNHSHDLGILCCTTGIGMSIAANRYPRIQASMITDPKSGEMTRRHNHSNVLCLGQNQTSVQTARDIVDTWLGAEFEGGRHQRRVCKIDDSGAGIVDAVDPEIAQVIRDEAERQQNNIELIASENFTSPAVMAAQGSCLTNKYAEGYPGRRWYGGCEHVDVAESLAIERAKELFGAEHANVQPHSGSQANTAVYFSVLKPGDKILTMDLSHGGHLTHGHKANFSGKFYQVTHYGVSEKDERIDYDALQKMAEECQPAMITAGASAYPRTIDFARMAEIAKSVDAYLFVDMAHISGLVAGGAHPSPIEHADFVTTTTHKSLRGPRAGIILCKEEFAKKIDSNIFPGVQGGPLMHVIAAKAVCLKEALQPGFKEYQHQVVANAQKLAATLADNGYRIVSGGTDNHLLLVDLRPNDLNGKLVQETLDEAGITVNKNSIPFDTLSPMKGGGVRIGTPAVTTRGMKEPEMELIGNLIHEAIENREDEAKLHAIRDRVAEINQGFPLP